MKKISILFLLVLVSVIFVQAQEFPQDGSVYRITNTVRNNAVLHFFLFVIIKSQTAIKTNHFASLHFHFKTTFYMPTGIHHFLLCYGTKNCKQ